MNPEPVVLIILAVVIILPLLWVAAMYNALVRARNACKESWADVDTELKRRYDLIPNLVEVVKGYAAHERDTLAAVIQARQRAVASDGAAAQQARDENALVREMRRLVAVAENYPALRADGQYRQLMEDLVDTEDRIQAARRFYNANVRDYANRIETLPSALVARGFGFTGRDYFEIDDAVQRKPVAVALT